MKKLSRVLAVILALALCLPGMAAAEMTEAEKLAEMVANVVLPTPELPLVDEPMTITVKYPKTSNHGDFDNCFYLKAVEKLTNIKLDVQGIDANGWDEKLALDFVSGDYSEIYLNGVSFNDAAVYGQAGMLRPLEDLLEQYAPNAVEMAVNHLFHPILGKKASKLIGLLTVVKGRIVGHSNNPLCTPVPCVIQGKLQPSDLP